MSREEWWLVQKASRLTMQSPVPLHDKCKRPFRFTVTDQLMEQLHTLDLTKHGSEGIPEEITDSKTRDRYLVSSLIEEAITSSQLEGAVTTRQVAKEMIRNSRRPRDKDERMIMNNYLTMQYIRERKDEPLTPEMVLDIHRQVTDGTMPDPLIPGRLRTEQVEVRYQGKVIHSPPHAGELVERMEEMCFFANAHSPAYFIHPVARAIILHFWLAYDHPFMDGNGRTARALFYWAMLHNGYWLFEFLPISPILRKEPTRYYRSFLLTETDDNDLTYFLIAQAQVIEKAIAKLSHIHPAQESRSKPDGATRASATVQSPAADPPAACPQAGRQLHIRPVTANITTSPTRLHVPTCWVWPSTTCWSHASRASKSCLHRPPTSPNACKNWSGKPTAERRGPPQI